jgi:hypothetical protein
MEGLQKIWLQWFVLLWIASRMRKLNGDTFRFLLILFVCCIVIGIARYGEAMYTSDKPVVRPECEVDVTICLR